MLRPNKRIIPMDFSTLWLYLIICLSYPIGAVNGQDIPCPVPNLNITPEEPTSITVNWNSTAFKLNCSQRSFNISINKSIKSYGSEAPVKIPNLNPNTSYSVQITCSCNNHITLSGVSNITTPRKLYQAFDINATVDFQQIHVNFSIPEAKNKDIDHFEIFYKHVGWPECKKTTESNFTGPFKVSSNERSKLLTDLHPYLNYNITVITVTKSHVTKDSPIVDSIKNMTKACAWPQDKPKKLESKNPKVGNTSVEIYWEEPPCDTLGCKLDGYYISWDKNKISVGSNVENYTVNKLNPFTKYTIKIFAVCNSTATIEKNSTHCKNIPKSLDFPVTTKPAAPPEVKKLKSDYQSDDWITVQWEAPDPPHHGILENYQVMCTIDGNENKWMTHDINATCPNDAKTWCHKCLNLKEKQNYTVQVRAKNKDVPEYGPPSKIFVETKEKEILVTWIVLLAVLLLMVGGLVTWLLVSRRRSALRLKVRPHEEGILNSGMEFKDGSAQNDQEIEMMYLETGSHSLIGTEGGPVRVVHFDKYLAHAVKVGSLRAQYDLIPTHVESLACNFGSLPQNRFKNRNMTLVPYDATRVVLRPLPGDEYFCSDYTNASYIDGFNHPKQFIASQGPSGNLISEFWGMVWHEKVEVIVMMTNLTERGKIVCEQYWPEVGKQVTYSVVNIETLTEEVHADFTFRTFSVGLANTKGVRKVVHLHFTSWSNRSVPWYLPGVASFLRKLMAKTSEGPILVHGSVGTGRTGTLILMYNCLRMAATSGQLDLRGSLERIRNQRPKLVDTYEQYEVAHYVLVECLVFKDLSVPCFKYPDTLEQLLGEDKSMVRGQFSRLSFMCQRERELMNVGSSINWPARKSRFPDIAPGHNGRVSIPQVSGGCDFINAVYVNGFHTRNSFIATQLPLPHTLGDFWRMVAQTGAELIVELNQPDPARDQTTCFFVPTPEHELNTSTSLCLTSVHRERVNGCSDMHVVQISQCSQGPKLQQVRVLSLRGWASKNDLPPSVDVMLEFLREMKKLHNKKKPTIVMCYNGARACGLLLALNFVMDKMRREQEVDVGLAVRVVRLVRPQFVTSTEQYQFLLRAAQAHLEMTSTYVNRE